ncbi:DUF4382 domain-containing protein [Natrialbaceae archaeon GCM10025810]|uniref:DUF4382 domain-containing protein n=1 Tax=Halovalidus salilacus TaxID=3075124 RepID=UPI00361EA9A8
MTDERTIDDRGGSGGRRVLDVGRRTFLAVGGGVGAAVLAGCAAERSPAESNDDETDSDESADENGGAFRLLISDRPADIGDFDRLEVTLDEARVFDGDDEDEDDENDGERDDEDEGGAEGEDEDEEEREADGEREDDETDGGSTDGDGDESASDGEDADENETDDESDDVERGFSVLDLEGATVDLTEVVGEKAISVFEGELPAGTYRKIELHVSDVEGIVDGEPANVKVPSEKLQITQPFEIDADGGVDFVFDINVVERGRENGYILKPVISESGVAGRDVDVEEVDAKGNEKNEKPDDEEDDPDSEAGESNDDADDDENDGDGEDGGDTGDA